MTAIASIIDLFNQSDWQPQEVRMWLQYEKDLALVESKLYTQQQEQQ
jgi:IS30 family transposase